MFHCSPCQAQAEHRARTVLPHRRVADAMRATRGNQALLRMSGNVGAGTSRPSRANTMRRECACGNSAGVAGACAECREKRLSAWRQERERSIAESEATAHERQAAAHRCAVGEDCTEDEPAHFRAYLGVAQCDENSGKVKSVVFKEHCKGDCVAQHEAQHVTDMSYCCAKFAACIKNAADIGERLACRDKYYAYANGQWLENYTECNAYTTENGCLQALLATCGFPDRDPEQEACCQQLFAEQQFVKQQMTKYCANAVLPVCPFI